MIETRFKKSEVGLIPEDWEVKQFENICSTKSGGTPSREIKEYYNGSIPWVTTGELNDGDIYDTSEHISESALQNSSAKIFPSGTLLMAMYGATIGKLGITQVDAATNQACCALFLKEDEQKYVFYKLLFDRPQLVAKGYGAGQPNISQSVIKKLQYAFPCKEEQSRIATALSDIDDLIATTKKLIEKKRNIKEGAMQDLLSGKRRLPGFKEKWVEKEVGLTGFTYNGLSGKSKDDFGSGNSLYITFLNVMTNPVIDTTCFERINIKPNERQNRALKGDIFFNTSSETPEEVGFCSYLDESIDNLYLNSFCFGFRITDSEIDGHFISYFWRSRKGRDIMTMLAQGSTRFNLSKALFKASSITIPSIKKEQKAIASILSDMDSEIQSLEARLTKYQSLKQGMMQQLLTGKIRLI